MNYLRLPYHPNVHYYHNFTTSPTTIPVLPCFLFEVWRVASIHWQYG